MVGIVGIPGAERGSGIASPSHAERERTSVVREVDLYCTLLVYRAMDAFLRLLSSYSCSYTLSKGLLS